MSTPSWLVFDLDHTLCYPARTFEEVYRDVAGAPFLPECKQAWMKALERPGPSDGHEAILESHPALSTGEAEELTLALAAAWAGNQRLYPAVGEALGDLRSQGQKLGLLTNGPARFQRAVIDALGIASHFAATLVSGDATLGCRKPDVRVFLRMAELLGAPPHHLVMVGDSRDNDIAGALAAGWRAAWISAVTPDQSVPDGAIGARDLVRVAGRSAGEAPWLLHWAMRPAAAATAARDVAR